MPAVDRQRPTFRQWAIKTFLPIFSSEVRNILASGDGSMPEPTMLNIGTQSANPLRFYLMEAYKHTYILAGKDIANPNEFYGEPITEEQKTQYRKELSFSKCILQFIQWPDQIKGHSNPATSRGKIATGLTYAVWGLALPFRLAWNALKIATELLPRLGEALCLTGSAHCVNKALGDGKPWYDRLWILPAIPLQVLYYGFRLLKILGTALTSPAKSMKTAWAKGNRLGGWKGRVAGGIMATGSGVITAVGYTLLFPLAIKAAMLNGPAFISQAVNWAAAQPAVSTISSAVTRVLGPIAQPIYTAVGETLSSTAVVVSPVVAAATTVLSAPLKYADTKIDKSLHHLRYPSVDPQPARLYQENPHRRFLRGSVVQDPIRPPSTSLRQRIIPPLNSAYHFLIQRPANYCRTQIGKLRRLPIPPLQPANVEAPNPPPHASAASSAAAPLPGWRSTPAGVIAALQAASASQPRSPSPGSESDADSSSGEGSSEGTAAFADLDEGDKLLSQQQERIDAIFAANELLPADEILRLKQNCDRLAPDQLEAVSKLNDVNAVQKYLAEIDQQRYAREQLAPR